MKKLVTLFVAIGLLFSLVGCANTTPANGGDEPEEKTIKMGVSYAFTTVPSLQYQVKCYEAECERRGWELILLDAGSDVEQQVADIESLIDMGVDFMVVFPVDASAGLSAIHEVKEAGIPLVFFSYPVEGAVWGEDYLTIATGDNKEQGTFAADYVKEHWEEAGFTGEVKYVNLMGPVSNSCAVDRSGGFDERAAEYGFINVATSEQPNWGRSEAHDAMVNIIQSTGGDFNCIYSGNEEMLLGAIAAMQEAGMDPSKVMTIGVDPTKETCQATKDGILTGIVYYGQDDLVDGSFRTWDAYQEGKKIEQITGLTLDVIDANNVQEYLDSGKIIN